MIFKIKYLLFYILFFGFSKSLLAQKEIQLKADINKALLEEGLTGAVWSIVDTDGKITYDAVGFSNKETGANLKPTDKVNIGSITKTLIATGILKLATERQLDLNAPVKKYLPQLIIKNQWDKSNPVTIRHLLDHTAGLTDIRLWQIFSEKANADSPLESAFQHDPNVLRVHTQPGSVFSYSNMGYVLLAMIVEQVTKERYEIFLDRTLLKPLGMMNSTFQFISQVGEHADKNLAFGHLDNQKTFASLPMYLRPAGQFSTTAYDMAIFAKFLMSDGMLNGKQFINHTYLLQMGQGEHTITKQKGLSVGYGLGAMKRDRNGLTGLAHSGNIVGYHAMLYWFPQYKKAFFISHNMDSETANYERFNQILIQYLKLGGFSNRPETIQPKNLQGWEGYYLPVFSKVEPFAYADILTGFIKVIIHSDAVVLAPFQRDEKILHQTGENILIADGKTENSHVFYKDKSGKFFISDAFSTHQKVSGYYLIAHWISFILGCVGILFLFFSSILQLLKGVDRIGMSSILPFVSAMGLFIVSIPFFAVQPFTALGDITIASILLFIASCVLPITLIILCSYYLIKGLNNLKDQLNFISTLLALQWVIVLVIYGLIPFRIWV